MAKYVFNASVFSGTPLYPATVATTVYVYDATTGSLAQIWEDYDGQDSKANPFNISMPGKIQFYANEGRYEIVVQNGAESDVWEDVLLGPTGGGGGGSDRRTVTAVNSSGGAVVFNYALGDYFTLAMSENITSASVTNPPASGVGGTIAIRITQDSTPRTFAFPANWQFTDSSPLTTIPTGSGDESLLILTTFDGGITWLATMDTLA